MGNKDSISRTLLVAILLCVICAVLVASAAVLLKPYQVANQEINKKSNILLAAGLIDSDKTSKEVVEEKFKQVIAKAVDLNTGEFTDKVKVSEYDPLKAAKIAGMSEALKEDPAGLKRRENISIVYLVGSEESPDKIVLPIRGYGLWSTMYGFIALDKDANTVVGFGFYQQGETPGLGGEVDNPKWKALWKGKKVFSSYESEEPSLQVVKGAVIPNVTPDAQYKVDGLAGATLTSRGVSHLVQYWLGKNGFAKFLKKYQVNGENNG